MVWSSDTIFDVNAVVSEERVSTDSVSLVACHLVTDIVTGKLSFPIVIIDIIRELRLVENSQTMIAIPHGLVTQGMLHSKTIGDYIIAVDDNTTRNGIHRVFNRPGNIVVGAP